MAPRDEKSVETEGHASGAPAVPAHPAVAPDHPVLTLSAVGAAKLVVPGGDFLVMADYVRHGADLILVGADGTRVLIQDYFASETPPPLLNDSGATIDGALASKLAGPLAPGQYAQAGGGNANGASIGKVETASGTILAKHADGTQVELHKGDSVFQGDVLQTAQGGSVGLVFEDGTSMSLGEKGRMVLDEMVYDAGAKTGDAHLTLVSGSFALVSGQIPKTTPDALQLKTPTMTVGIRGTGLAGNGNTVAMMAEKGGVAGEVSVTTSSGQTLTLNSVGAAAVLGANGSLTTTIMSPLQVMQVAGNAGSALPNAGALLSNAFNQAAAQVQQQLQQQQPPPPPPPPPPPADKSGAAQQSPLQQLQALHEAQVASAVQQIKATQALVAQLEQKVVAAAIVEAHHTFTQTLIDTTAADNAAKDAAIVAFAKVQADFNTVSDKLTAALSFVQNGHNDAYQANLALNEARAALATLQADAQAVRDAAGAHAPAQIYVTALTDAVQDINGGTAPLTTAQNNVGIDSGLINSHNITGWSDGSLITTRVSADGTLASDTAQLGVLKGVAEAATAAARAALLNLETPLVNAAAAEAALGVQTGALVDTLVNYLNAAKGYLTIAAVAMPAGWTSAQAEAAILALANNHSLTPDTNTMVGQLEAAIQVADAAASSDTLLTVWKSALASAQTSFKAADDNATSANSALTQAQLDYTNAQNTAVTAAGNYASKQDTVATDSYNDGLAVGNERGGEAAWQASLDQKVADALTAAQTALGTAATAATNAGTDAQTALANAVSNHLSVSAATAARDAAITEVSNATAAQTAAQTALTNAITVLHSYGIDTSGAAWSGSDANVTTGIPSDFSNALTADQSAVASARQAALATYKQVSAVAAQVDQQLSVATQQKAAAVQALTQAQALQLQIDLQNAQDLNTAQTNADSADTSAHNSANAASAAATAAASSRDAIKTILDSLNATTPPANVTGSALTDFNTQKAGLIATVQGYYSAASTAADSAANANSIAGADATNADTAQAAAHANGVSFNTAKSASSTAAQAAADAASQGKTASSAANTAATNLAQAAASKSTLAQAAADASAAQSRNDDLAAAQAAQTDIHAIINSASNPTSGSLIALKTTIQAEYDAAVTSLGTSASTDTSTLYGMLNAAATAKAAALAVKDKSAATLAAYNSADAAYTAIFNAINTANTGALAAKTTLGTTLSSIDAQLATAKTAFTTADNAVTAIQTAITNKTSTSALLAQAIQADQSAQQALSHVTASQNTADKQTATFNQQLQTAQTNITTAINSAAKAADLAANVDAAAAQSAAALAQTDAATARAHAADADPSTTNTAYSAAQGHASTAKLAFDDVVTQVQAAYVEAQAQVNLLPSSTPAATKTLVQTALTALGTVSTDAASYANALHNYDTSATAANLAAVNSALAKVTTDLALAQTAVNNANATTATAGVAAIELSRAEQVIATAGNAYLQALQSRGDAQAAAAFAADPTAAVTYWKAIYDNAMAAITTAHTTAGDALTAGTAGLAKAISATTDASTYITDHPGLPQAATDALTAATQAKNTATSVVGVVTDASTLHTIYGEKAAVDAAYAIASAVTFSSGNAAAAAAAVLNQVTTATDAAAIAKQLAGLATQAASTAVAQDSTIHNLGLAFASPSLSADSIFVLAGPTNTSTTVDIFANDVTGGGSVFYTGTQSLLAGYTLTLGTASHGSVSVTTVNGHLGVLYTGANGYVGPDGFSYTVTYLDSVTGASVSSTAKVSVVGEGANITAPGSISLVEGNSTSFNLAVNDVNTHETLTNVTISGAASGSTLTVGTTSITADGSGNFVLSAAQAASSVISVTPPAEFSGQMVLTITAVGTHDKSNGTGDPAAISPVTNSKTVTLNVAPITHGATITVPSSVTAVENTDFTLALDVSDSHVYGSLHELVTGVTISGLQTGATLSIGSVTLTPVAGVYTLSAAQASLATLTVHMPANYFGDQNILISATAQNDTAAAVTVSQAVAIHVGLAPLTAAQGAAAVLGSGNTHVKDSAANIAAVGTSVLQAHGISSIEVTGTDPLVLTAAQAQALTLTFTTPGGAHVVVADTGANLTSAAMIAAEAHGLHEFALTNSGSYTLAASGTATLTGGSGNDTYVVPANESGTLTLIDTGGTNVIDGSAVHDGGFRGAQQVGNDLQLQLSGSVGGGSVLVKNQFTNGTAVVDHVYTGSDHNPNETFVGLVGGGNITHGGVASFTTGDGNQQISVANSSAFTMGTALTIEAWINPTSTSNNQILMKGEYGYAIGLNNGHIEYWIDSSQSNTLKSTGTVPTNTWTHIAVTVDTTTTPNPTLSFYINGVAAGTISNASVVINNHPTDPLLYIGQQTSAAYNTFAGQMDEVRLWNKALNPSEISANVAASPATNSAGLVADWKFGEGSGTTTADATGNGHTATLGAYAALSGSDGVSGATLTGGTGAEIFASNALVTTMIGGGGEDTFFLANTNQTVFGDSATRGGSFSVGGQANFVYAAAAVTLTGGSGAMTATFGGHTTTLNNINHIVGSDFNDSLSTTTANVVLDGGAGNNTLSGNSWNTTASYQHADGIIANLSGSALTVGSLTVGTGTVVHKDHLGTLSVTGTDTLSSINIIKGSSGNDYIHGGDSGSFTIDGGGGTDTLTGGLAATTFLITSTGSSTVTGGSTSGFDTVEFSDFTGGSLGDSAFAHVSAVQALSLNGGLTSAATVTLGSLAATAGVHIVYAGNTSQGVTVNASTQTSAMTLTGGGGNDTLLGGSGTNILIEQQETEATSTITVGASATTITGTAGTDVITGATQVIQFSDGSLTLLNGGATIIGGSGDEHLVVGVGNTLVKLGSGTDSVQATAGNHTFELSGTDFNSYDTISGGTGVNTISLTGSGSAFVGDTAFANVSGVQSLALGASLGSVGITPGSFAAIITLGSLASASGMNTVDASATTCDVKVDASGDASGVTFKAGSGIDAFVGGTGHDVAQATGLTEAQAILSGWSGNLQASNGTTAVITTNVEELYFSDGKSLSVASTAGILTLTGGTGADVIHASTGIGVIDAGSGGDDILSSQDSTTLFRMHGGLNSTDTITGGSGNFATLQVDGGTVTDTAFSHVSGIGTLAVTGAGNITLGSLASSAGITTVDASASTGSMVINASGDSTVQSIIGGSGSDTAVFQGAESSYTISSDNAGHILVTDASAHTTTLSGVETLQFTGGGSLSVSASAALSSMTVAGVSGSGISFVDSHVAQTTLETWVKFDSLPTTGLPGNVFGRANGWNSSTQTESGSSGYTHTVFIDPTTHKLQAYVSGAGNSAAGNTVIQTGQWYHIALTVQEGGVFQLYVNGVADTAPVSVGVGTTQSDQTNVFFGGAFHMYAPLNAEYASIATWDNARSAAQVAADMHTALTPTTGLVGLWNPGMGTTGTITDLSGHNNTASYNNATANSVASAATITGTSGVDAIHVGSGITAVDAGSGDDIITSSFSDFAGMTTVIGGTGNNQLVLTGSGSLTDASFAKLNGIASLALSGSDPQSLTLGSLASASGLTTIDASATTGNVQMDASGDASGVTFKAGSGVDSFIGGSGHDAASLSVAESSTVLTGWSGNLQVASGSTNLTVTNVEDLYFSDGNSLSVASNAGILTVTGGSGNDTITVATGVGVVNGGDGNDTLSVTGFAGGTTLVGGAGADTFVINAGNGAADSAEVIADFTTGTDKINISADGAGLTYISNGVWKGDITSSMVGLTGAPSPTAFFFTDGTDGWLVFSGGAMDGDVVKLSSVTMPPAPSDFTGGTVSTVTSALTVMGTAETTGVLFSQGTGTTAVAKINSSEFGGQKLSVEFDVSIPTGLSTAAHHPLLGLVDYNGNAILDARIDLSGHLALSVGGATATGTHAVTTGAWHHVAITFDGSLGSNQANIYLDGTLAGSAPLSASAMSSLSSMAVGGDGIFTSTAGMFDNVKLWSSVLTSAQLADPTGALESDTSDLVGSWVFNEAGASTSSNLAGNNYMDMVLSSGGHMADAPLHAAHLSGSGLIDLNASTATTGTGAFTYGTWVKTSASTGRHDLINFGNTGGATYLYMDNGHLAFGTNAGNTDSAAGPVIADGEWHYVTATYNGSGTVKLYVDGNAIATDSQYTGLNVLAGYGTIGGSLLTLTTPSNPDYQGWNLTGTMGDASVWSAALTQAQIQQLMSSQPPSNSANLLGYWKLDDSVGTTAHDLTGHYNGTYPSGTTWTTNHADVVSSHMQDHALTFAGGQYASAGNIFNPSSGHFAMEAWVNPDNAAAGHSQMIIAKDYAGSTTQPVMSLYLGSTGHLVFHTQTFNLASTAAIPSTAWTHVAVSRGDDGLYLLMVNGAPVAAEMGPALDLTNSFDLMLGARNGDDTGGIDKGTVFVGKMAGVNLFNESMGPEEVAASMNGAAPSGDGLVASWAGTDTTVLVDDNLIHHLTDTSGNGHGLTLTGATAETASPPLYDALVEVDQGIAYHGAVVASDSSGAHLTYTVQTVPPHGTLSLQSDGTYIYTPDANYVGADSFVLNVSNGLTTTSQTVALEVKSSIDILGARQNQGVMQFNGSQHASTASTNELANLGKGDFSVEAWIDPTAAALTGEHVILSKQTGQAAGDSQFRLILMGGHLAFEATNSTGGSGLYSTVYDLQSTQALTAGQWAHVGVTRSGDTFTLYINGQAAGSVTHAFTNSDLSNSADLWIGQSVASGSAVNGFAGDIADVKVWNHARTTTEMVHSYNTSSNGNDDQGLIGHWDGSGGLTDQSGRGHDLTLAAGAAAPQMIHEPEKAMHFNGGAKVVTGNNLVLTSHTVEAWIRTSNPSNGSWDGGIFSTTAPSNSTPFAQMGISGGKLFVEVSANGAASSATGKSYIGTTNLADGLWHNVAYTVNTSTNTLTLYVDGVRESTTLFSPWDGSLSGLSVAATGQIGTVRDDPGARFNGDIADVRVWGAALTQTQIQQGMNTELTGNETGLLANWHLDDASGVSAVADSHSPANNGSVTGSVTSVDTSAPIYDQVFNTEYGVPYHGTLAAVSSTGASITWHSPTLSAGTAATTHHGMVVINADGSFTYAPNTGWHGVDYFNVQAVGSDGATVTKLVAVEVPSPVDVVGVGASGACLQFNGAQHATSSIVLANQSFSFEFWNNIAKANTGMQTQTLMEQAGAFSIGMVSSDNLLTFTMPGGHSIQVGGSGAIGLWTHWAGSYNAATQTMSLYENGQLVGTAVGPAPAAVTGTGSLYVGSGVSGGNGLSGQMDEVRLFSDVRTAAEVADDYHRKTVVTDDHVLANWSMDREVTTTGTSSHTYVPDTSGAGNDLVMGDSTASGAVIHDITGNGHSATLNAGASFTVAAGRSALHLTGTAGGIVLNNETSLATGTGSFTHAAWVRIDPSTTARGDILGIGGANTALDTCFYVVNGQLHFDGEQVVGPQSTATVNDGNWHYVAVTYDSASQVASLYIDGAPDGSSTLGTALNIVSGGMAVIGDLAHQWTSSAFVGDISDVAVWSTTLDTVALQSAATSGAASVSSNLLGNWTMGEAASQPQYENTLGHVAHFSNSGNGSVVSFGSSAVSNAAPLTATTIEAWVRTTGTATGESILGMGSNGNTPGAAIDFQVDANGHLAYAVQQKGSGASSAAVNDGLWHHVALSIDASGNITLFVDGHVAGSSSTPSTININSLTGFIGKYLTDAAATAFNGDISDVRVWNYARTVSEINSNMNTRMSGAETGLMANWRLDDVVNGDVTSVHDSVALATGGTDSMQQYSVTSAAAKPAVFADTISVREDVPTNGTLHSIDLDNPSALFTGTLTQLASHGTVTLTGGGSTGQALSYTYTPNAHYFGSDSFVVGIDDGSGVLTYKTIGIAVKEVHEAPQITGAGDFSTDTSGAHTLGISVADNIGTAAYQKYQLSLNSTHGNIFLKTTGGLTFDTVSVNGSHSVVATGSLDRINAALATATYVADSFWGGGADTLNLQVWDMTADSAHDTLVTNTAMAVTVGDRAPTVSVAMANTDAINGASLTGSLSASDPEGGTVSLGVSGALHGNLHMTSGTTFIYEPDSPTYAGAVDLTFVASDTATNSTIVTQRVELYGHQGGFSGSSGNLVNDQFGLDVYTNATVTRASGGAEIGGFSLTNSTMSITTGGSVLVDVGGSVAGDSFLGISGGGTVSLAANALIKSDGTVAMTHGTLTGAGTLRQTGGMISLSGTGNDIAVAYENTAAATMMIFAVSGTGSSAVIEHGFDNLGGIRLEAAAGSTSDFTSALTIAAGNLINDGILSSSGQPGAGDNSLILTGSLINHSEIDINHNLLLTAANLTNTGKLVLSGATLTVGFGFSAAHTAFDNSGSIRGSGVINDADATLISHGYITPGDGTNAGTLHVTGDMTLASDSHVVMDLSQGGTVGTSHNDQLMTDGTITLGGQLDISDSGNHSAPTSITLMTWGKAAGEFDSIHGLDDSTHAWVLDPVFSSGSLTLTGHTATVLGSNAYYSDTSSTANYVIGNNYSGNDEVHLGSGADVFVGHGGSNTVGISGTGFHFLDGGAGGNNQLVWEATSNNNQLDFTKLQINAIQNFDVLKLNSSGNNDAVLDLAHLLSMTNGTNAVTGTAHTLVVIGGDQSNYAHVSFADSGWHQDGKVDLTVNNQHDSYTQYSSSNGNVHVLVDSHTNVG